MKNMYTDASQKEVHKKLNSFGTELLYYPLLIIEELSEKERDLERRHMKTQQEIVFCPHTRISDVMGHYEKNLREELKKEGFRVIIGEINTEGNYIYTEE